MFQITTRGNRRQVTYVDDIDRSWAIALLAEVVEKFEWDLLAYCLMSNHHHYVVHTPKANLSAGMQRLNGIWAQRFNWRHGFEGHLFERPFRSSLAKDDDAVREFVRYTLLNPVRAGMVARPGDWPWSSYRASAGHVPPPGFLALDRLFRLFDEPGRDRQATFVEFVTAGIRSNGRVLGPGPETRLEEALAARRAPAQAPRGGGRARRPPGRARALRT
jgi:REP element-mobilizing transposase RayT